MEGGCPLSGGRWWHRVGGGGEVQWRQDPGPTCRATLRTCLEGTGESLTGWVGWMGSDLCFGKIALAQVGIRLGGVRGNSCTGFGDRAGRSASWTQAP